MRTLSIKQPWAWLILNGGKDIENRTWPTKYRGSILIHAGKIPAFPKHEWAQMGVPIDAPTGGIVGMVDIIDCVKQSESEWFQGPYGFVLRNPRPVEFAQYRGQLGLFNIEWPSDF